MKFRFAWMLILLLAAVACTNDNSSETSSETEAQEESTVAQEDVNKTPESLTAMMNRVWTLESYVFEGESQKVYGDSSITISFVPGRVFGIGGCNNYSAEYDVPEDGKISFGQIGATKKMCSGLVAQEQRYLQILESVDSYTNVSNQLDLKGEAGALVFKDLQ